MIEYTKELLTLQIKAARNCKISCLHANKMSGCWTDIELSKGPEVPGCRAGNVRRGVRSHLELKTKELI